MITLTAKKPGSVGNGILYGSDQSKFDSNLGEELFLVETDFGNRMRLNSKEMDELFYLNRMVSYEEWDRDRMLCRTMDREPRGHP